MQEIALSQHGALCSVATNRQNVHHGVLVSVKLSPSNLIKATRFFVILSDTSMNM
jgi:hypothetical protein